MDNKKQGGLFSFVRNTSFLHFFLYWVESIFIFAVLYWLSILANSSMLLEGQQILFSVTGLFQGIYASFLIATLFGVGKIGYAGWISGLIYVQVAFTIIIILILVDKLLQKYFVPHYHLVSVQDKKINTVMLMMSIFRNDVDRIIHEFRSKSGHHVNLREIEATIDGLYVSFLDVEKLFSTRNPHRHTIKNIQYLMLTDNIDDSLEKLEHFIDVLEKHKIQWKDKSVEFWLRYILETADKIAMSVDTTGIDNPKVIIAIENIKEYTEKIEKKL